MRCLRDEVLVAYADNQLNLEKRRAVEQVLAVDPEARHTVALFKLSACQVRECFNRFDFTGIPGWFDALSYHTDHNRKAGRSEFAMRLRIWPRLAVAAAACLVVGVAVGQLVRQHQPASMATGLAILGELPRTSVLADALDHVAETGADWTGPDRWRATEIASFRDRFGNECREVELYSARGGVVPAQVFIACRGSSARWTVVGAVANEVTARSYDDYYVPTESEARSSLDSVLSMLGAQQRTSAADRKTMTP